MISSKKGQGLSLNAIIVAALALVVLVVMIAIFSGQMIPWGEKVNQEGKAEIIKMKISYGECHPTATEEAGFSAEFDRATSVEEKEAAGASFKEKISSCKGFSVSKDECESSGCTWG